VEARQTGPAGSTWSGGQKELAPLQYSLTSQGPTELRHSTPDRYDARQSAELPVQKSGNHLHTIRRCFVPAVVPSGALVVSRCAVNAVTRSFTASVTGTYTVFRDPAEAQAPPSTKRSRTLAQSESRSRKAHDGKTSFASLREGR
jgi:hypothetical protein